MALKSKADLIIQSGVIKDETQDDANTQLRIGQMFEDSVESSRNIVDEPPYLIGRFKFESTFDILPINGDFQSINFGNELFVLADVDANNINVRDLFLLASLGAHLRVSLASNPNVYQLLEIIDLTQYDPSNVSITTDVAAYDNGLTYVDGEYYLISFSVVVSPDVSGYVTDAPFNGVSYIRKNEAWSVLPTYPTLSLLKIEIPFVWNSGAGAFVVNSYDFQAAGVNLDIPMIVSFTPTLSMSNNVEHLITFYDQDESEFFVMSYLNSSISTSIPLRVHSQTVTLADDLSDNCTDVIIQLETSASWTGGEDINLRIWQYQGFTVI